MPRLLALLLTAALAAGCTGQEPSVPPDRAPDQGAAEAAVALELGAWHDLVTTPDGLLLVNGYPEDATDARPLELWRRTDEGWEPVDAPDGPTGRNFVAVAVDPTTGDVVLHGGLTVDGVSDETWVYDGAWTRVEGPGPGPRASATMAHDETSGRTLLYGGDDGSEQHGDTWAFDGATWQRLAEDGPDPVRWPAAMETDPDGGVVLYGGHQVVDEDAPLALGDTWRWDGGGWREVPGASQPGPLVNAAMVVHPAHGLLLLGGGDVRSRERGRVWRWTGAQWRALPPGLLPGRQAFGAAYDADQAVVVLTGGLVEPGSTERHQDTWVWSGDPGDPAQQVG
ncbi:kelch repeat-containing protein [Nocardioides bigeumensis]|uniref:Galactose oxidase n=1 Tax=Nocardioides bigeumensis TaxID=433657 RepID=A0ABP5KFB9_9ACTN